MLRTASHRLLARPWWFVLAATAAAAIAGGGWVALIAFILVGGALVTARNLVRQDVEGDAVLADAAPMHNPTDPPWEKELGCATHTTLSTA